jgi:ERF superfamily protein
MTTSESIVGIMKAIQTVQQNADTISKKTKGQVGTRVYMYANLVNTWEAVKSLLKQNDLVVVQSPMTPQSNHIGSFFQTTIFHVTSGEWIQETMPMILQRDDPQAIGSAITYYRRYMLTSMLGLIPDDDTDAKEQRLATAQQKSRMVGSVKQIYPELEKPEDIINTIQNIVGKHPTKIREDEAEEAINSIKAFTAKAVSE